MYFDIAMPLTLFFVTLLSVFLNEKTDRKLKSVLEERKFALRDAILLLAAMAAMVSLIAFIPQMAIMTIFLFSYSTLLFIFTYLFSNKRWYVATLMPALFVFLYLFFNKTPIWSNYLINLYGVIFAILITLYLGSLFTWKTSLVFAVLLTIMDAILVFTGTMGSAATATISLNLPVLITVQTLPAVVLDGKIVYMRLGLGDLFFAGLLAIQTFKTYGRNFAILSVIAMATSFFIFEAVLLTYGPIAFPGTLMIICGWLPLALWKRLKH